MTPGERVLIGFIENYVGVPDGRFGDYPYDDVLIDGVPLDELILVAERLGITRERAMELALPPLPPLK